MWDDEYADSAVTELAGKPALVQSFEIDGLYGYRNVSLETSFASTILIAKNGSGKTTLLGALDAFLKRQFLRLRDLNFSQIRCRLYGIEEELVLTQDDIAALAKATTDGDIVNAARKIDISPAVLFTFLTEEWPTLDGDVNAQSDNQIYNSLWRQVNYSRIEVRALIEKLYQSIFSQSDRAASVSSAVKRALEGFEVVYLPTYRRIELSLRSEPNDRGRRRSPKFNLVPGSLHTGDIQFGLADISDRLAEMNQTVLINSNSGYREISADIINELIDGSFAQELKSSKNIPSRDELILFFSRLRQGRRVGPYFDHRTLPNIDKIYTKDGVPAASTEFLNYFLSKLGAVINATHDVELQVQDFIAVCNKYLSSIDESSTLEGRGTRPFLDGKVLRLNRENLNVHVETVPGGKRIGLDSLSSGEKQMISLFAKLFLYPGNKIVLIDEPELSLSIDWQKEILVDVLKAATCRQLIAITHSPFVFDNALEPYAKSLRISLDMDALSSIEDEGDEGATLDD